MLSRFLEDISLRRMATNSLLAEDRAPSVSLAESNIAWWKGGRRGEERKGEEGGGGGGGERRGRRWEGRGLSVKKRTKVQ